MSNAQCIFGFVYNAEPSSDTEYTTSLQEYSMLLLMIMHEMARTSFLLLPRWIQFFFFLVTRNL